MARALSVTLSLNQADLAELDRQRAELEAQTADQWDTVSYTTRLLSRTRTGAALLFMRHGLGIGSLERVPAASKRPRKPARPRARKPAASKARRRSGRKVSK